MTDGFVLQQHRPFNAVNTTCYLSGSRYELSNFNFICAQQFLLEVSLRTPSLPTHLLSTFTMPAARVGLSSRSQRALSTPLPISQLFWITIPMCFVSFFFRTSCWITFISHVRMSRVYGLAHLQATNLPLFRIDDLMMITAIPWNLVRQPD